MYPDCSQQYPVNGQWRAGHKLKYRKFHLDVQRNFFTVKMAKDCNRLPKEVVESPFSKILGAQLDIVLSGLL